MKGFRAWELEAQRGWLIGKADDSSGALVLYLCILLLLPSALGIPVLGAAGSPALLFAVALFLWWIWDSYVRGRLTRGRLTAVEQSSLILGMVVLLAYAFAMGRPVPLDEVSPADSGLIRMSAFIGIVLTASTGLRSWRSVRRVISVLLIIMGALTILAFIQIFSGKVWVDQIRIPGLAFNESLALVSRTGQHRPSATSTHPLEYGALIGLTLPLALAFAMTARRHRSFYAGIALSLLAMSMFTVSRTTLISTGIGMLIMLVLVPGWWRLWALVAGGVGMFLAGLISPGLWGTIFGLFAFVDSDPSVASRVNSYPIVAAHLLHSPLLGRGYGTFLPKYWILDNLYLTLLLDIGIIGLIAFVALIIAACGSALAAVIRSRADDPNRILACGVLAGVASGAVIPVFFDALSFAHTAGVLMLLIGLAGAVSRLTVTPELQHQVPRETAGSGLRPDQRRSRS